MKTVCLQLERCHRFTERRQGGCWRLLILLDSRQEQGVFFKNRITFFIWFFLRWSASHPASQMGWPGKNKTLFIKIKNVFLGFTSSSPERKPTGWPLFNPFPPIFGLFLDLSLPWYRLFSRSHISSAVRKILNPLLPEVLWLSSGVPGWCRVPPWTQSPFRQGSSFSSASSLAWSYTPHILPSSSPSCPCLNPAYPFQQWTIF